MRLRTVLVAIALLLVTGEVFLRLIERRDVDGQLWVGSVPLRPYRVEVSKVQKGIDQLKAANKVFTYDPMLGWALRPNTTSADGRYGANAAGMRGSGNPTREPQPDTLRVVILGDSFTFGDEIAYRQTWGRYLERDLIARGIRAEVLNLGVNGYGVDQAYLRWEELGKEFHPHVVILGFQAENVLRNLNVFRPIYYLTTGLPFSKPRFIEGDKGLVLVNQPAVPLEELPAVLAGIDTHPLAAHERFLGDGYRDHWWLRSRLVSLLFSIRDGRGPQGDLRLDRESVRITKRILAKLSRSVTESGAAFLILHVARRGDLEQIQAGRKVWYAPLLDWLLEKYTVVRPEEGLTEVSEAFFRPMGHYSGKYNQRVAAALVGPVLEAAPDHGVASVRDPQ